MKKLLLVWLKYHIAAPNWQGHCHTLIHNKPSKAIWLLGMNIAADGNYTTELSVLQQCQTQYSDFLQQQTPLTQREAQVIYCQC